MERLTKIAEGLVNAFMELMTPWRPETFATQNAARQARVNETIKAQFGS